MKWLFTIETENDLIVICRLMNIFRRKGVKLVTLTMASAPESYSLAVVVEAQEADAEHNFHFLRRTEGVKHVTAYRHDPSQPTSFVFVDAEPGSAEAANWPELFRNSKVIFASHGKALVEVPSHAASNPASSGTEHFIPFACVRTTRSAAELSLSGAASQ